MWQGKKYSNADALSQHPSCQCGQENHGKVDLVATARLIDEINLREQ